MNPNPTGGATAWVVQRAANLAPEAICHRLEEEWLADLSAQANPLLRLRFALGCCWAALVMRGCNFAASGTPTAQAMFRTITSDDQIRWRRPAISFPLFRRRERIREDAFAWLARLVNSEWVDPPQRRSPVINAAAAMTATFIAALPLVYTHHYMPGLILGSAIEGSFMETMGTVYASDRRTMRRVVLADGTRIVMNRGTRMVVLYSKNWRSVLLMRGEATFTVARQALRPFELTADGNAFRTLAATFNIHLTGRDAVVLTVLEGTVTMLPSRARATVNQAAPRKADMTFLAPSFLKARQTVDIEPGKASARTLSELEAQARIAWQGG
jgi:hypothetical protein